MTFFQDFPVPPMPPRPRATRYAPPPWAAAPAYELPAVVHLGTFLHRSPTSVVALRSAEVFSTGVSFNLSWVIRRSAEDEDAWDERRGEFFRPMGMQGRRRSLSGLMFGVQFPDGSKASTGHQGPHGLMDTFQQPAPPTLALHNGGGSGADDELAGSGSLWLWPLPPGGGLRLFAQWTDFGLDETSVTLDGGQLAEAASGVQQYWPGEDIHHG
ncbi:hypothetical protein [Arthrobacter sp. C152]